MLVFVLNQTQKANTGKIQTPVYENVREFGKPGLTAGFFIALRLFRQQLRPLRRSEFG